MRYTEPVTEKQWAYIRNLAHDTGEKIRKPRDRRAANREIKRLEAIKKIQAQEATGMLF